MKKKPALNYPFIFTAFLLLLLTTTISPAQPAPQGWFPFPVRDLDTSASLVDLSFLNEDVAGKNGYVRVKNGHFINGKGERIKFFGENLTFSNSFPEKITAQRIAASLEKKGMNVIRFHHMDMRMAPDGIWNQNMNGFDSTQLDKLDYMVYQLKMHGIYSNLNLHVSFTYPESEYNDAPAFKFGKSVDHFYRPYIHLQKKYTRALLSHLNPYTGTAYTDEPAVAFIEINNENSLLSNWAHLPKLNDSHKAFIIDLWAKSPYQKNAGGKDFLWIIENYSQATGEQKEMLWSFLLDVETSYAREMISFLKDALKVKALVSETQASYSGVGGVYRESKYADYIDMHAYWEHPNFPGQSWSRTDWLIRNSPMVSANNAGTLARFGQHRVKGMPLTISEYDHPAPTYFAAEMYPMLNSVASFQDLDGIYHFTFDGPYDSGRIRGFFSSAGHPMKQLFIPVGAALFRMNEVKAGEHTVTLNLPGKEVIPLLVRFGDRLRLHGSNMAEIWNEAGASGALTLQHPMNVDLNAREFTLSGNTSSSSTPWTSDTKEIRWENADSSQAVFTINTPYAKAAIGYIGGKNIKLNNVTIAMDTTAYNWAVITLTALDRKPIKESSRVLLVAGGRVENTGMGWNENKTSVSDQWGSSPTVVEGIPATITCENGKSFRVVALDASGSLAGNVEISRSGSSQKFNIGAHYKTLWYMLVRD